MAYHFSANQFEDRYSARRLNNWELCKWYPDRPRNRKGFTKFVADNNGRLQPNAKRIPGSPWGNFRSTWELPDKITRRFGNEYHQCLIRRDRYTRFPPNKGEIVLKDNYPSGVEGKAFPPYCKSKCETVLELVNKNKEATKHLFIKKHPCESDKKDALDLEYVPGDFTSPRQQHPTRQHLLQEKYERDNDIQPELELNKLHLGEHDCALKSPVAPGKAMFTTPWPQSVGLTSLVSRPLQDLEPQPSEPVPNTEKMPFSTRHRVTEKPHERCPSPIVPAYANFELAKRMHQDNLDHQPLPDCVADLAYRKLQITGANPGLALEMDPIATGVGIKTHNAGPTHCTKMRVYRPKTCGVVPKPFNDDNYRTFSAEPTKKMGAMDLAIRWDYQPPNPYDEPKRPVHIDGSNDSAGPAVFTCVKTPRDDANVMESGRGRSAGVFTNTLGEPDFFDKDIMRRKTDFTGRNIVNEEDCRCGDSVPRARSVSRDLEDPTDFMPTNRFAKKYQSTPDVMAATDLRSLREKYLGHDGMSCERRDPPCKRGFLRRSIPRLCHKVAPASGCPVPSFERHMPCKAAFRAGLPKYNATGQFVSDDSGCSFGSNHGNRVLVVPRPRNPYAKRNYDIDTLVPPFTSYGGGAGEGGYPEHWRLASVYQHAYKPMEQRRRPLLQTVYK